MRKKNPISVRPFRSIKSQTRPRACDKDTFLFLHITLNLFKLKLIFILMY